MKSWGHKTESHPTTPSLSRTPALPPIWSCLANALKITQLRRSIRPNSREQIHRLFISQLILETPPNSKTHVFTLWFPVLHVPSQGSKRKAAFCSEALSGPLEVLFLTREAPSQAPVSSAASASAASGTSGASMALKRQTFTAPENWPHLASERNSVLRASGGYRRFPPNTVGFCRSVGPAELILVSKKIVGSRLP